MKNLLIPVLFAIWILPLLFVPAQSQVDVRLGAPDSVSYKEFSTLSPSEASIAVSAIATPTVVSVSTPVKKMDDLRLQYLEDYLRSYGGGDFRADEYRSRSIGSGVIVTTNGYVLTNNHVVDGAYPDSILVTLHDSRSFYATLVGQDERTDLALLKIYTEELDAVRFASANDLHIGEWVLALGSPLGLRSTVTFGIISALNREIEMKDETETSISFYIQTDAAINPGNSGGGLFNLRGELVGINTAIYSNSGFYQGYGFAVPVNVARSIAEDLIKDGKLDRGYLGITARNISDTLAARLYLDSKKGVVVDLVEEGSPAQKGGLQADDVVMKVNSVEVESLQSLKSTLAMFQDGESLKVSVIRGDATQELTITLGSDPFEDELIESYSTPSASLGVEVRSLEGIDFEELKLPGSNGLYIERVTQHGTADQARLFAGDVLLTINGERVFSMQGLSDYLATKKAGEKVTFTVWRKGKEITRNAVMQPKH